MKFSIGIAKFLLLFVLCIGLQTRVDAENKVTVTSFNANVPTNDVVQSWNSVLDNSLISSTIKFKENFVGVMTADIRVFQDQTVVKTINQRFAVPLDPNNFDMCGSIGCSGPDDNICSLVEGEQSVKDCDISSWFSELGPGEYKIEGDIKEEDNILTSLTLDVTIESE